MSFSRVLVVCGALSLSAPGRAQDVPPSGAGAPSAQGQQQAPPQAKPPEPAPDTVPPAPPTASPSPPAPQSMAPVPPGQWVYTAQYGWVWMPYASAYTYVPPDGYGEPYMYVYHPYYGWNWLGAPWVWGWGPWPVFGVAGPGFYAWYGWGGWREPWRFSNARAYPYRPGGMAPAPRAPLRSGAAVAPAPRPAPAPAAPRGYSPRR